MKVRDYILNNWKLKLLSLFLAIILWFVVLLIGETKKVISVPVNTVNLRKDLVITRVDSATVDITLTGRVSVLKDIRGSDIRMFLDVAHAQEGENIFNISKVNVEIPRGVQIDEMRPSSVKIDVDRMIEKRLKTVVRLSERLSGKYTVQSWAPAYVTARGPRKVIEDETTIETVPVNTDPEKQEQIVSVALKTEEYLATGVTPDTVRVLLRKQEKGK